MASADLTLFDAVVPPLKRLVQTVPRLLDRLDDPAQLEARLAPDCLDAGQHLCIALGFVVRTVMPLMGDAAPEMPMDTDPGAILALSQDMAYLLDQLDPDAFVADDVRHIAGEAELTQTAQDFALLYALPNAQFHLTLAYASLRMAGAQLGKGDLDGFHVYTADTNFVQKHHLN